jgi:hypothetical protein
VKKYFEQNETRKKIYPLLLIFAVILAAAGEIFGRGKTEKCGEKSVKVLMLGTYHMANPRLDAKNLEADDVLLPKRQRELVELAEKLARFKPTKIAVEAAYQETFWTNRYKRYLANDYELGRNEIEQIGFRLAKQLNHAAIYPVDYPMLMSGLRYDEVDFSLPRKPNPSPAANQSKPPAPPTLSEDDLLLRRSTITEFLRYVNDPAKARREHGRDYLEPFTNNENPAIYEQADRVANWYKRNLRMFANLNRIADSPDERILLIVGAGHLTILRDFVSDAPQFCLAEARDYLK